MALAEDYKSVSGVARGRLAEEPLFDGVAALIESLAADGWLLGIATGKSDRGLALCSRAMASSAASHAHTADPPPLQAHPSMIEAAMAEAGASSETTWMIGDTTSTWRWPARRRDRDRRPVGLSPWEALVWPATTISPPTQRHPRADKGTGMTDPQDETLWRNASS